MEDQRESSFFPARVSFGKHSLKIPYLTIIILIGTTGIGGTCWALFDFVKKEEFKRYGIMDKQRHEALLAKDESHDGSLEVLSAKLGKSLELQHWQAADQAATRVCSSVKKSKYVDCYKRILRLSMRRVENDRLPCAELTCKD